MFEPTTSLHLQYHSRDVKLHRFCTITATVCECNLNGAIMSQADRKSLIKQNKWFSRLIRK